MRNIIEQIIEFYPDQNVIVSMESGDNASGRPGSLFPPPDSNPDAGLFLLENAQGVVEEALSICRIAAIRVTSAAYDERITYLPVPDPAPVGCEANCEAAIRAYLPVGTNASINAGGQTVANGVVIQQQFGMTVVQSGGNIDFVSNCKAEIITLASGVVTTRLRGIQAQLGGVVGGSTIADGSVVVFDNVVVDMAPSVTYSDVTGEFTILAAGNYFVAWWVAIAGAAAATNVSFAIQLNGAGNVFATTPNLIGNLDGTAFVSVGSVPSTIRLVNLTGDTVFLPEQDVVANIVILKVEL